MAAATLGSAPTGQIPVGLPKRAIKAWRETFPLGAQEHQTQKEEESAFDFLGEEGLLFDWDLFREGDTAAAAPTAEDEPAEASSG